MVRYNAENSIRVYFFSQVLLSFDLIPKIFIGSNRLFGYLGYSQHFVLSMQEQFVLNSDKPVWIRC